MVVKHLSTFITKNVPNGLQKINILNEIKEYKRINPNKTPILVFDFGGFPYLIINNELEIMYGGRQWLYLERTEKFLKTLIEAGAKLVFFFDGVFDISSFAKLSIKQKEKFQHYQTVVYKIENGSSLDGECGTRCSYLQRFSMYGIKSIVRKYAECITPYSEECDKPLASYAIKNDVFAVINNDSDYLIFEGNYRFWNSDINVDTYETLEFNKKVLLEKLNLKQNQMPLLATLAGNRIIDLELLKPFINSLGSPFQKFKTIARFINNLKMYPSDIEKTIKFIENKVLSCEVVDRAELLKKSLDFYNSNFKTINDDNLHFLKKTLTLNDAPVYELLMGFCKSITVSFYNIKKPEFANTIDCFLKLYKRMAGVILKHKNDPTLTRRVLCQRDNYMLEQFNPEYPKIEVPDLQDLFDDELNENLKQIKYDLLCWIISDNLPSSYLNIIEKKYLCISLTLFFLVENKIFTVKEADMFLHTMHIVYTTNEYKNLTLENLHKVNPKAFQLVFVYAKFLQMTRAAMETVGLSDLIEYDKFDGIYYHHNYDIFMNKLNEEREKLLNDVNSYRLYAKIQQ